MMEKGCFSSIWQRGSKLKPDREDRGGGWLSDLSVCVYLKQGSLGSLCPPVSLSPIADQTRMKLEIKLACLQLLSRRSGPDRVWCQLASYLIWNISLPRTLSELISIWLLTSLTRELLHDLYHTYKNSPHSFNLDKRHNQDDKNCFDFLSGWHFRLNLSQI